jgi:hypothetical protein
MPKGVYIRKETQKPITKDIKFDEQDRDIISRYTWSVVKHKGGLKYAYCQKTKTFLHRLLIKTDNKTYIDHINGNGLDNRRCNLRVCTHTENMQNRKMHKNNTSGYKGVYQDKRAKNKKWVAVIRCNGVKHFLGIFTEKIEAAKAYNSGAIRYFGEFARINKI